MDVLQHSGNITMDEDELTTERFESLNTWCEEQLPSLTVDQLCQIARAMDIRTARVKDKSKFRVLKEIGMAVDKKGDESLWLAFLLLKIIKKEILGMKPEITKDSGDETEGDELERQLGSPKVSKERESEIEKDESEDEALSLERQQLARKSELDMKVKGLTRQYLTSKMEKLAKESKDFARDSKDIKQLRLGDIKKEMFSKSSASASKYQLSSEESEPGEYSSESDSDEEAEVLKAEMSKLAKRLEKLETRKREKKGKCRKKGDIESLTKADLTDIRKAWRPPFKIIGQIGKIGQKDKLDFISLMRQIEAAKDKDPPYSESDIIEGVIRATTAGTQLRTFLESFKKDSLDLDRLIEILESYYLEADSKDLLRQLATLKQEQSEDAQSFVMRGLELMHLILSEKKGGKKSFDQSTVEEILRESLDTGFVSDSIRTQLHSYLQGSKTFSEVELMRKVSIAMKSERDRKSKFEPKKKVTWGNVKEVKVDVEEETRQSIDKSNNSGKLEFSAVTSLINEMRAEVAELRTEFRSSKDFRNKDGFRPYRIQYGCNSCKAKNVARSCRHCFKCGDDDHKAQDCNQRKQSKDQGSLPGDDQ